MPFIILRWVFHQKWLTRFRYVHEKLMKGFENHADRGLADAQELYGFLLLHKGIDDSSKSAGARYLMMCVDVSRPKVCWQLHKIFEQGNIMGFPADEKRSSKYLALAREAGHPLAVED